MIAFLEGTVDSVSADGFVIACGGVGYFIGAAAPTMWRLTVGQEARVYTRMIVREDSLTLVGFLERGDLAMFDLLTGVTGVGAKVALSLLGAMKPPQLSMAILTEDVTALCKAPGVGKKVAARIALELKDKIAGGAGGVPSGAADKQQTFLESDAKRDAADALVSLGYGRGEASRAVLEVALEGMDAGGIIKLALRKLTK